MADCFFQYDFISPSSQYPLLFDPWVEGDEVAPPRYVGPASLFYRHRDRCYTIECREQRLRSRPNEQIHLFVLMCLRV